MERVVEYWNGLPRGGGGVTILGNVQQTPGCGTQCPGLVDKVGSGHRLGVMILKGFSNLHDSMNMNLIQMQADRSYASASPLNKS